jgi:hypothetical protein
MDRTTAYAALYARLKDKVTGITTFTRRAFTSEQMPALPALEMYPTEQVAEQEPGRPTKWRLNAEIVLYVNSATDPDLDASPDDELLTLITQVDDALKPQPGEPSTPFTTLGGACNRCWISGSVVFVQGASSDPAMAVIPVEMIMT